MSSIPKDRWRLHRLMRPAFVSILVALLIAATLGFVGSSQSAEAVTKYSATITSGGRNTCALQSDNQAYCWGSNSNGQIGTGDLQDVFGPTLVSGGYTWKSISSTANDFDGTSSVATCGVTTAGVGYCWGPNDYGQIGDGTVNGQRAPTLVSGGITWKRIFTGTRDVCGITSSDAAYCWGANTNGGAGNNTAGQKNTPVLVSGGRSWSSLSVGDNSVCGITTGQVAYCWGANSQGQLGITNQTDTAAPSQVAGGFSWLSISAGVGTTCGVTTTNTAYCWGTGILGNGSASSLSTSPTLVAGALSWASISAAKQTVCGLTTTNLAYCWGTNASGAVGDTTITQRLSPVAVSGSLPLKQISAGSSYYGDTVCALTTFNTDYCWGYNASYNVGDGTTTDRYSPTAVVWQGAPATNVLGQNGSYTSGNYGTTADLLSQPKGTDVDTVNHRMFVADTGNNRILVYNLNTDDTLVDRTADFVLGQASFTTGASGQTAATLYGPSSVTYDKTANYLYVVDQGNNRVLVFDVSTITNGEAASYVLGQPNFTTNTSAATSTTFNAPTAVALDTTNHRVYVADSANSRILVFGNSPLSNGAAASFSIGQSSMTGNGTGVSQNQLNQPSGVAYDGSKYLYVGDTYNNRVLAFDTAALATYMPATYVVGQPNFTATGNGATNSTLNYPKGLAVSATTLFVAESNASRVMVFNTATIPSNAPATSVYGQAAFNRSSGAATRQGIVQTQYVSFDSTYGRLLISDPNVNRVTQYDVYVGANQNPDPPVFLSQLRSDGVTTLSSSGNTNEARVTFRATISDADPNDADRLCVEVQPLATAFTGTETTCGPLVPTNSVSTVSTSVVNGTKYHWQARTKDVAGAYSAWTTYNGGTQAFTVNTQTAAAISTGGINTCAIQTGGDAYCWGDNAHQQLGDGTTAQRFGPTLVEGNRTWTKIFASNNQIDNASANSCAIDTGNSAYCWGSNSNGEFGNGTTTASGLPTLVSGGYSWKTISIGLRDVCGITTTNVGYCWGANDSGASGNNTATQNLSPVLISGGRSWSDISVGDRFTCGVTTAGAGYCWGKGTSGHLGNNSSSDALVPSLVSGGYTFSQISAGGDQACGVTTSNSVYCWGTGFLGAGSTTSTALTPGLVSGSVLWSNINVGNYDICGLDTTQNAYCWGRNDAGGVGVGTTANTFTPAAVVGGLKFTSLSIGKGAYTDNTVCGLTTGNFAYCWGSGGAYQLGNGTTSNSSVPISVLWQGQPARTVFGQLGSYTTNGSNLSASNLARPQGVVVDTVRHRLFVADTDNNRVLAFNLNTDNTIPDTVADFVLGQPNMTSNTNALTQTGLYQPSGLAYDATTERLYVGDQTNARVMVYSVASLSNGQAAIYVLGQPNFTTANCTANSSTICAPTSLAIDTVRHYLFQADANQQRVLVWDVNTLSNGKPASFVIGQPDFGGTGSGLTANSFASVFGVAYQESTSRLFVTDRTNSRVLVFNTATITNGMSASFVLGQPNFTSNNGQAGDNGLYTANGLALGPDNSLFVVDGGNNRIVQYDLNYLATYMAAKNVVGQPHFARTDTGVTRSYVATPTNAYFDTATNRLFVADSANHRVLSYSAPPPTAPNSAPSAVTALAQFYSDGTTSLATGGYTTQASVVFKGLVSDPDAGDTNALCVELKPIGTAFTNTETACGSAVASEATASLTLSVTNGVQYHWQTRSKDAAGLYSTWTTFNSGAAAFTVDATAPSAGQVFDGATTGVQSTVGSTSLSQLSANWTAFAETGSGLASYSYSIGTSAGATDTKAWTSNALATSVTTTGLTLKTSQTYFFNVRALDNAGNVSVVVSSPGQTVKSFLTVSVSTAGLDLGRLGGSNGFTGTGSNSITTSTNAYSGYAVRLYADQKPTSSSGAALNNTFTGSFASPAAWSGFGFGYTSSDTLVAGTNRFSSGTAYAVVPVGGVGDIVADNPGPITGAGVSNEVFTVSMRQTAPTTQAAGSYAAKAYLNVIPSF